MSRDIRFVQSICPCFDLRCAFVTNIGAVCGICRMFLCMWCVGMFVSGSFWCGPAVGDGLETKFVGFAYQLRSWEA